MLNQQFTSVFTKEGPGELPELGEPYPSIPKFNIVTEGVEAQLRRLNPSKAQGPDELPPWFLSMIASELVPIYQNLFQCSVDSGQVPDQWKEATVAALFKKGSRAEASNYRPVSLTVITCKILEHIIHSHVMDHLESLNILTDQQHGFRAKRSTETQLILTNHDISKMLDDRKEVDVAVLDFSKAFDKVPHRRLIATQITALWYYWISPKMGREFPDWTITACCSRWPTIQLCFGRLRCSSGNCHRSPVVSTVHQRPA